MELRHLRYAVTIAETLHFTRAAERLGIGQPPLSQQIKLLEDELGVKLFNRLTRRIELSEAGQAFMPLARTAIAAAEQAAIAARRAARGEIGQLSIGFTSSASFNPLVMRIITQFRERYSELSLLLVENATAKLLSMLHEGTLDVGFVRPTAGEVDGLRTLSLPDEPMWAALPTNHPLASTAKIKLVDLSGEPFILYPRSNGRLLYDTIIAVCHNAGFSPKIAQEAPQMASTVTLVASGIGVTLVPESMRQLHAMGVTYVPISGEKPFARLVIAHCKKPTATITNFLTCAAEQIRSQTRVRRRQEASS